MLSVGETLKRARLEQGLDMSTVAARTKISAKYLEAIESDDRKMLPSGFFYKSFVEQYAKSLSLDMRAIDAEVDRVLSADEPLPLPGVESVVARNVPPLTSAYRFRTGRSFAPVAALVLVIAGCSGIYAWWHSARSSFSLRGIIDHAQRIVTPALGQPTASTEQTGQMMASAKAGKPELASKVAQPAAQPAQLSSTATPATTNDGSFASTEPAPAATAPSSDYKVLVDLMAHEATWLSVSSDGKPVFSGTLQANETKTVGSKQFAKVRLGNAAGVEVRLNGKLLGPLGARGQVLTVLFTPDNFQIFAPPKESD